MSRRRDTNLLSQDDDDRRKARRMRAVTADLALRATGQPCPGCGQWAVSAGGEGCRCRSAADHLVKRALANADAARGVQS